MNNGELKLFLAMLRELVNNSDVDPVIRNHARGILVRIATTTSDEATKAFIRG